MLGPVLVADAHGGPERNHSGAPGAALDRSLLDDDRRRDLLAQAPDLRLEVRLVVLGGVVLGVLAQLAQPLGRDEAGGGVSARAWHRTSLQTVSAIKSRCSRAWPAARRSARSPPARAAAPWAARCRRTRRRGRAG